MSICRTRILLTVVALAFVPRTSGQSPPATPPGRTTLSHPQLSFTVADVNHLRLSRGPVSMVVVGNGAYGEAHRAGYNGVAELRHDKRAENVFVPAYAGLNHEHIHDGSSRLTDRNLYFEPRRHPMQLRRIDEHTVELVQAPTPTWKVESATRYELLADGVIEMTFHCRATEAVFEHGYVGFFWASYIDRPESKAIHFRGVSDKDATPRWIEALSPSHGVQSTHRARDDNRIFDKDDVFPDRSLIFAFSNYRYTEPFYYGVSHGMALIYIFRPQDRIRMTQSPTGGGATNPAWDFQWLVPEVEVGRLYGFRMRAAYVPFTARADIARLARRHVAAIASRSD